MSPLTLDPGDECVCVNASEYLWNFTQNPYIRSEHYMQSWYFRAIRFKTMKALWNGLQGFITEVALWWDQVWIKPLGNDIEVHENGPREKINMMRPEQHEKHFTDMQMHFVERK